MTKHLLAASSALALAVCSYGAQAQSIDYGSLEQLFGEPVTTSATGSPQKATEAPADMEIITADDIRRSGAKDIPGVLRHVSGIDVLQWTADDADVGIRGYNQPLSPRLLVLLDGRQVYADYYNFTPWSAIPVELNAIRQIEIVKGPATALFGFNAVSGVINIITYSPLYDNVNTTSVTGGTQGLYEGSTVNTFKLAPGLGVRIEAGGRHDDEFNTTGDSLGFGQASRDRNNFRESFDIDAAYNLRQGLDLGLEVSHNHTGQTNQNNVNFLEHALYTIDSIKGSVAADTPLGLIDANAYTNWVRSPIFYLPAQNELNFGDQVTVLQLQDLFKLGSDHTFRASAEYRRADMNTVPATPDNNVDYSVASVGGMWAWQVTPSVSLTNALRIDHLWYGRTGPQLAGGLPNSLWNNTTLTEPSFNSALVWKAGTDDTLRLTAAQGVQVPSLQSDGGYASITPTPSGFATTTGLPTLQPTIVRNYEISWDHAIPSFNANLRLSAYHQTSDNVLSMFTDANSAFTIGNTSYTVPGNIGSSKADGAELELKGKFLTDWRWGLSYTPEFIKDSFNGGFAANTTDYQHTTPNHVVKANLGWSHGPWEIDGFVQYESAFQGIGIFGSGLVQIPDYVSADARVGYNLTDWATIALSAQNALQAQQTQTAGPNIERRVLATFTVSY